MAIIPTTTAIKKIKCILTTTTVTRTTVTATKETRKTTTTLRHSLWTLNSLSCSKANRVKLCAQSIMWKVVEEADIEVEEAKESHDKKQKTKETVEQ